MRHVLRLNRARIAYVHDVVMAAFSFLLSLYLRLGDSLFWYPLSFVLEGVAVFTAVAAGIFLWMRLYRGIWRYASLNDMLAITRAVTLVLLTFLALMFVFTRLQDLPRSMLAINWFVLMALLGGPRILYRTAKDHNLQAVMTRDGRRRVPVLLVGAGDGAELFIRAMNQDRGGDYRVVGIVDQKGTRVGRNIHGLDVMGDLGSLDRVVAELDARGQRPQRIIITTENIEGAAVRALLDFADTHGMTLSRLPRLTDFRSGQVDRLEVKPIAVEDLLGRPQTVHDRDGMRALIAGRRVMVTGAGGTIGSELVRQIADFGPARLDLLDNGEFNLYAIERELAAHYPALARSAVLGDVRDGGRVARAMAAARPELVFHAAALKHVPMVELQPAEAVLTNVVGTRNVAAACRGAGTAAMVLISSDKAVNPANVMGATKRVAESLCQALDIAGAGASGGTRFITVRFGNVLGSTGSVVPLFQHQLAEGGPLTVTDPAMTRYFMTTREAVELVLQASVLGTADGAGNGKIFVLDMGEPVRIAHLAKQMIRLAGFRPGEDIGLEYIGLRPGEKMHEELFHAAERPVPTARRGILLASPRAVDEALLGRVVDELAAAAAAGEDDRARAILRRLVPEYRPGEAEAPGAAQAGAG